MIEKRSPHCELSVLWSLIAEGKVRATFSATAGAEALGFDFDGMVAVVLALRPEDFYKSMTTYINDSIWQDVYRPIRERGEVYLKLTVIDDVLIVSFKEL